MVEQTSNTSIERAVRVLLLESMEGVGRVTARKVLTQFSDLYQMGDYPREQVLNRLKGVASASKLIDQLLDHDAVESAEQEATKKVEAWASRRISVQTFMDETWPARMHLLPNSHKPNMLYTYGDADVLQEPTVAIVARGALMGRPFEAAQSLIKTLGEREIRISTDVTTGFDVVAIKLCQEGSVAPLLVSSCGLSKTPHQMRAHASQVVKDGGALTTSLPMDQGPFDHDKRESAFVQTAIAKAVVFVDPKPGDFEWSALEWALTAKMAVFAISDGDLPHRVHRIRQPIDMEWVIAAVEYVA